MSVKDIVQEILDDTLLKYGVVSHHLRHIKTDVIQGVNIKANDNEYVVYRFVSSRDCCFGDGEAQASRTNIDINYYYSYENDDSRYGEVIKRINEIKRAFKANKQFRLQNGESDIYELDNNLYRGINIEFSYLEAIGSE